MPDWYPAPLAPMDPGREPAAEARTLFQRFLAERWSGGPRFEEWLVQHPGHASDLRMLRDQWLVALQGLPLHGTPPGAGEMALRSSISFSPGETLGGFLLLERLGGGGMGDVWKAEELAFKRTVALKLLRPEFLAEPRALERFRREALAGARVQHSGVVVVYSYGRVGAQPFIAQEYVAGGRTLADWITERQAKRGSSSEEFRRAAGWAAEALQAAHQAGVLHRDVKPRNLLLSPEGHLKVADFGLARIQGEVALSQSGSAVGTFCYMSPEQVHGRNDELDARTDVFGLGATLYELLTLERAFPGDTVHSVTQRILNVDPPDAREKRSGVPRDLAWIAAKALEKRPADRFPDMRALAEDLRCFLEDRPIRTRGTSSVLRARKWTRRHPTVSVATTVGLVALLGLLWLLRSNRLERAHAERETLFAQAQWAIEVDDLDRARVMVERANALEPGDPQGHLILAAGYAHYWRTPQVLEELERARAKGFSEDPAAISTALEHGAHALYLQAKRDPTLYALAQQEVEAALSLDPSLYAFQFTLYQIRSVRNDVAGALQALEAYKARLPVGSPFTRIIEALLQERAGDLAGALATLEKVRALPGMSEEELAELRWHRSLGRICYLTGDLERAEDLLRQAVAAAPRDCGSWQVLALTYLKRVRAGDTTPETARAANEDAQRALECSPALIEPILIQASLALEALRTEKLGPDPTRSAAWREARAALDALRAFVGEDAPELRTRESYLLVLEAQYDYSHGRYAAAAERYQAALEADPRNLPAAMYLGQCRWWMGEYRAGLELLERTLEQWDDASWKGERNPAYLGALLAWIIGCASKVSEPEALARAAERLVQELERGVVFNKEELLSAAEFLATAPEGLRDCGLARTLIEEHGLTTAFDGLANASDARAILEAIARACR